jgi:hypothetical protein
MKLNSINSHIWWKYDVVVNNPLNLEQKETSCFIESEEGNVSTGKVTTYSGDTFCKEEGRKRSLKKCIEKFPRQIRSLIWNEYHSRSGSHAYKKELQLEATT